MRLRSSEKPKLNYSIKRQVKNSFHTNEQKKKPELKNYTIAISNWKSEISPLIVGLKIHRFLEQKHFSQSTRIEDPIEAIKIDPDDLLKITEHGTYTVKFVIASRYGISYDCEGTITAIVYGRHRF